MSLDRLASSNTRDTAAFQDASANSVFKSTLRRGIDQSPVKIANGYRRTELTPAERWLPAEHQHRLLTDMGYEPVGEFTMRVSPSFYGLPHGEFLKVLDEFRAIVMTNRVGAPTLYNAFILPLQGEGRMNAGILAPFSDASWEVKQAITTGRFKTESVFVDVEKGSDRNGQYYGLRSRVYVLPIDR